MKEFFLGMSRAAEKLRSLLVSKTTMARRGLLRSEERERQAREAERLDRLRNPQDYRGR